LKLARDAFNMRCLEGRTSVLSTLFARLLRLRRKVPAHDTDLDTHDADYRAVSIAPTQASCSEARRLRHARFLLKEVPRLPLPECPQRVTCTCSYRKFPDRRLLERRDIASSGRWFNGDDRRKSDGRRATDHHLSRIEIPWSPRK
jgi:hypothetical protein